MRIITGALVVLISFLFITESLSLASEESTFKATSEGDKKRVFALKKQFEAIDEDLTKESPHLLLFAQLADPEKTEEEGYLIPTEKVVRVINAKSWPDYTTISYLVLLNEAGFVEAFEETPVSESGDWSNSYTHYFDRQGRTIGFKRYSGFFMGCPSDVAKETSIYYFDEDQKIIQKEYTLVDKSSHPINPKVCDFMYRHEYTKYKSWKDLAREKGISENLK